MYCCPQVPAHEGDGNERRTLRVAQGPAVPGGGGLVGNEVPRASGPRASGPTASGAKATNAVLAAHRGLARPRTGGELSMGGAGEIGDLTLRGDPPDRIVGGVGEP